MIRHPRLALPFSILADPGAVRLVAGEDFRFSLSAPGLDEWLPDLLKRCDGKLSLDELLAPLAEPTRSQARTLLARLEGERVLVDGPAKDAHRPRAEVQVFRQDSLDFAAALRFSRERRREGAAWLWVSTGAMGRGYVSPVFLPDAGPCLGCLLRHFRMLSPAPEIHDALLDHSRRGTPLTPVPFPEEGTSILEQLVRWKVRLLAEAEPPAVLYRLHVLEVETLEVSSHRVFIDPECPECGREA